MPNGQRTREKIIAEAAALFNQRGFEGGSMSELMEATGLEKCGIYRHFSSKEELAAEAFVEIGSGPALEQHLVEPDGDWCQDAGMTSLERQRPLADSRELLIEVVVERDEPAGDGHLGAQTQVGVGAFGGVQAIDMAEGVRAERIGTNGR